MKRQWLIDAYNVMHQLPEVKTVMNRDISEARRLMAIKAEQLCAQQNSRAFLVFDGAPDIMPIRQKHLTIEYSYPDNADALIIRLVSKRGHGHKWTVVTDDRELRRNALLNGAELMGTKQFCNLLSPSKPTTAPEKPAKGHPSKKADIDVSDEEVQEMLRLFKNERNDASKR
ncbi:MAG TPA: NYN domain-containing protein [Balneolales bacterium]|nr:NYN domain-containing protein [Balneolales bacterium]